MGLFSYNYSTMKIRFTTRSVPAALLITTLLSYGLLINFAGFYWDDWPFAWIAKFLGPHEFFPAFAPFRPFLAPIFFVTTSLIPPVPLYWQIFALVIRFVLALAAWWTCDQIWPEHKLQNIIASLLFLVFPGYSQHWVALTHINQELIPLLFYVLSFGFTARALRAENSRKDLILAILFHIAGIFPTEYFFGLETLRILLIFSMLPQMPFRLRARESLKKWLPHLIVWILNAVWLIYYYKFGAYNSYGLAVNDVQTGSAASLFSFIDAIFKAGLYIWIQIPVLIGQTITTPSTLATIGLIAVSFLLLSFYFSYLQAQVLEASATQFIIIGIIGILVGRLPSWVAGLPLTLQSINDRFMVSMMIGGTFFIIGLIELIFKSHRPKIYIYALLVAFGIGQQFFNANAFRRDWTKQQEFYWQMAWRIPDLQKGTLVLTHELPVEYETDFSATAALNWIYAPNYQPLNDLPYALMYTRSRLGGSKLPDLYPGTTTIFPFRTATFHGNTSASLTVYMPASGCLRVLDPIYANESVYERYTRFLRQSIPLSDPSRIATDKDMPAMPESIFGKEPDHGWCYFYEKAELARQTDNWDRVAELGDEALQQGYTPQDPYEWLPFIEAYALVDKLDKAEEYTSQAFHAEAKPGTGLCQLWKRVQMQAPAGSERELTSMKMINQLQCAP